MWHTAGVRSIALMLPLLCSACTHPPGPELRVVQSKSAGMLEPQPSLGCDDYSLTALRSVRERPKRRHFSIDGYVARELGLELRSSAGCERHTVDIAWRRGTRIRDSWFRAIANTLARVPPAHARLIQRLVIDHRPREHGIAPHDRARSDDARDGHTIWLSPHVFRDPNHWARGNYGSYWSYHVDRNQKTFDGAPAVHDLFSPVLLHELGHLVMYHHINRSYRGPAATSPPACAEACPSCGSDPESGCVSAYCQPFAFDTRTENWAEQYRFFYQSSATRAALLGSGASCLSVLEQLDDRSGVAPWQRNLPDNAQFTKSRWDSCGGRSCKAW
jgi:hypothetical protein